MQLMRPLLYPISDKYIQIMGEFSGQVFNLVLKVPIQQYTYHSMCDLLFYTCEANPSSTYPQIVNV